ncbi:hypothetical protein [Flagellimonas oceanensis]|uniref:ORC-CDC6 family AAA ATPase n=1 Tax=Flagellimonas oceanensis TaxID=2499163 RepID=UPI000F8F290F|nr:hypothetical protein [Allomuricauda oceanensis]|tara:strand:+ start:1960 stop:3768 length:1809 start_codon:yes stop_codon:yes gene_type:complete
MKNKQPYRAFKRDLFEIENARNLTTEELVQTFVPTPQFWRILSAENNVILGSRGSGKTALAKMLSHSHLSKLKNSRSKSMIEKKSFFGMYISTKTQWIGSLSNKNWLDKNKKELLFQWKLNVASCHAFLTTLDSCLIRYYNDLEDRVRLERKIISAISKQWIKEEINPGINSIKILSQHLDDISYEMQYEIAKARSLDQPLQLRAGPGFHIELFEPLKRAIKISSELLSIPSTAAWLLCIDEAENLPKDYHKILNSHLRADSGNLFLKITTTPYCHYTLETNMERPINEGDDFDYVYIDQDPYLTSIENNSSHHRNIIETIFKKRLSASNNRKIDNLNLDILLGKSVLLDYNQFDLDEESEDMQLFKKYANTKTIARSQKLMKSPNYEKSFRSQFGRKMKGMLLLKNAIDSNRGKTDLDIYSGVKMLVSCADGNPRRLIKLLNSMIRQVDLTSLDDETKGPIISPQVQTKIFKSYSKQSLNRFRNDTISGSELYNLVLLLGEYMEACLHKGKVGTEQFSSFKISNNIPENLWKQIKRGVDLGLIYHNINKSTPDYIPQKEGVFRFAYILAPNFNLLPRRGSHRDLMVLLTELNKSKQIKLIE